MTSTAEVPEAFIIVRWARFEDLASLERLRDIWELRDSYRRAFEEYRAGRLLWLVADIGGKPVGTVWGELFPELDLSGETMHVVSFRVDDSYQGLGIGSKLLAALEEEGRRRGRSRATLYVAKDNHRALGLYRRRGYEIVGERQSRFDYTDPAGRRHQRTESQYVMAKRLIPPVPEEMPRRS